MRVLKRAGAWVLRERFNKTIRPANDPTLYWHSLNALIHRAGVSLVADVGANVGDFVLSLRHHGYEGRIVSFEPSSRAFAELQDRAKDDSLWEAVNVAIGSEDSRATLNVSQNSVSSSLHDMHPNHLAAAPTSAYVATEEVLLRRVDTVLREHIMEGDGIFLKVDVQGHEADVLEGAKGVLDQVLIAQLEIMLDELYIGQAAMSELISFMAGLGFEVVSLRDAFHHHVTRRLLAVDALFVRAGI